MLGGDAQTPLARAVAERSGRSVAVGLQFCHFKSTFEIVVRVSRPNWAYWSNVRSNCVYPSGLGGLDVLGRPIQPDEVFPRQGLNRSSSSTEPTRARGARDEHLRNHGVPSLFRPMERVLDSQFISYTSTAGSGGELHHGQFNREPPHPALDGERRRYRQRSGSIGIDVARTISRKANSPVYRFLTQD